MPQKQKRRREAMIAEQFYNKVFCLEVWGDYACFTRPEMKAERVSYDVITPSAARGIFEAIFWKPALRWEIKKIEVLNPIKWISVRRNELASTMSPRTREIFVEDNRQQRAGLFLRDVRYRLHGELVFIPLHKRKPHAKNMRKIPERLVPQEERESRDNENPGKYNAIFERRARKGQCFNQPYLGCREFSCDFRLVNDLENEDSAIQESRDLGFMLYDLDFSNPEDPKPAFFRASLQEGILNIPSWESEEVRQ